MDTTPKYISMAEKAKEIQKRWESASGDWISHHGSDIGIHIYNGYYRSWNVYTGGGETEYYESPEKLKQCTWLPRQDQLQEILVPDHYECALDVMMWCWQAVDAGGADDWNGNEADTIEQLLLRFVMWEKFNKVWDGKDWVHEKN